MKKLVTMALICLVSSIYAQNPIPFDCTGSAEFGYYTSSASSSVAGNSLTYSSSRISKLTTGSGLRTDVCLASEVGVALNGLAFNPHDNFLYAVSRYDATQFSGTLYRIGENCQKVELPVSGNIIKFNTNNVFTIDAAGGNISSATFDLDNHYYVNTSFTNSASSGFTNKLQKIEITATGAEVLTTVTLTCPSCTGTNRLRITDVIFDESTGRLYGSNRETNQLYWINTSTGVITAVGSTGITSPILGIYKSRAGTIRAISENGNIYAVNLATGNFTTLTTGTTLNSGNADGASGCYAPPSISGTIFIDANGLTDMTVNGTGTPVAGTTPLFANLVQNGMVLKSTLLSSAGFYKFMGLFSGVYQVQVSSTRGTVNQAMPAQNLPANYAFVGDHIGTNAGNDGSADGMLTVTIAGGSDVVEVNFGIDGIPMTTGFTTNLQENPASGIQVDVPALSFSDPEESDINNITIETLPNSTTMGVLYYDGVPVTAGQYIPNYDASLLTVDPVDGEVTVTFTFFTTDMAGLVSNTSTINMPFSSALLPVTLTEFSGYAKGTANVLQWITATEINSDYFSIERSTNRTAFEEVGQVAAKGNSTDSESYSYLDEAAPNVALYRLKIVDHDGNKEYSKVVRIESTRKLNMQVYPTTVTDVLNVNLGESTTAKKYQVIDTRGAVVATGTLQKGSNLLDLSQAQSGIYLLSVQTGSDTNEITKFIKI